MNEEKDGQRYELRGCKDPALGQIKFVSESATSCRLRDEVPNPGPLMNRSLFSVRLNQPWGREFNLIFLPSVKLKSWKSKTRDKGGRRWNRLGWGDQQLISCSFSVRESTRWEEPCFSQGGYQQELWRVAPCHYHPPLWWRTDHFSGGLWLPQCHCDPHGFSLWSLEFGAKKDTIMLGFSWRNLGLCLLRLKSHWQSLISLGYRRLQPKSLLYLIGKHLSSVWASGPQIPAMGRRVIHFLKLCTENPILAIKYMDISFSVG